MDFTLNEEEQAIAGLAAQVLGDASSHEHLRAIERGDGPRHDPALWANLAGTGVLGAFLPEQHGGAGLGLVALAATLEQAGQTAAAAPLWETVALGALPIAQFAPAALAGEVLPAVAAGDMILTAAWHEDGGECLLPTTVASRPGDGDAWSLTGTKICVPAGQVADAFVVPAAIEGGSVGLFLVRRGDAGVAVEPHDTTFADPQGALLLADAPAEAIGMGTECLEWAYQRAVAMQCSYATGVCAADVALTAQYTKDRKQFDVPIATFQAVAHRAADAYMDTEAIRLTSRQAAWRLDAGLPAANEVDVAKFWASWGGQRVVHAGQHLHGGMGVDRDYPLHRFFLQAKQIELQLGGTTRHLLDLGRRLADEPV
jgi:alkylation response protein AidB-like acyl-CoA dehydrogenase